MSDVVQRPAPAPAPIREQLALTERERELILALRRIDLFRAMRERSVIIHWSGARLRVFDAVQLQ